MKNKFTNWLKAAIAKPSYKDTPISDKNCISENKHIVLTRQQVINAIVNTIKPLKGAESLNSITLWVSDAVLAKTVQDDAFLQELSTEFDNTGFYSIGPITVMECEYPTDRAHTTICPGLDLTFGEAAASSQAGGKQLRLAVVEGTGSTEQPDYILDGKAKTRYCIGRGRTARTRNHYRVNDIIIRADDPDEIIQKHNNCVSSAHADIVITDGEFFLQVAVGGCRNMGGSATKVIRDQHATEITDTRTLYRLHDGDMLDLGTEVLLTITIIS